MILGTDGLGSFTMAEEIFACQWPGLGLRAKSKNAHPGAEEAEGIAAEGNKIELETKGLFFGSQRPLWNKIAVRNNERNLDPTSVSLLREHIIKATDRFSFLKSFDPI